MFRTEQITTATRLVKSFRAASRFLNDKPQPLLITQKSGRFLVLVPAPLSQFFVFSKTKGEEPKDNERTVRDYIWEG